ncbi:MAG: thioredoxin domain-containing protein [Chloroflexota bacterium]|nr:thioredoxin domain-containing protein [Chloroflexota bacterium]
MEQEHPNRLISEKSPYLLQHAGNPVDWYPWCDEAFKKAREEDKPIFLSIGYSTCHWCHVMAHESFENERVAQLMNDAFVSIKVDREERPDIDSIYMTVAQMMTGAGGWPLTIIMTPEKKPFFAATYIPRESRFGRAGMVDIIPRIKEIWETRKGELLDSAKKITAAMQQVASGTSGEELSVHLLSQAYAQLAERFDAQHGGFGAAPKFPTPHNLSFLLRYWRSTEDAKALAMAERTLQAMRLGGMYDHIGFGFHRYSTDREWLVPHFEKMLYDQAMLAMAYTEAFQATGKDEYRQTAQEIFAYIRRDMTSPEGGFYSAEDADSEGSEGKFYVWTEQEIRDVLGSEAEAIIEMFGVTAPGNFAEEATGSRTGANILHLRQPIPEHAGLDKIRKRLFEHRESRIHPHKDDKILTDWNGLMIAAFAKGAQAFDEPEYAEAARQAADFILQDMSTPDGRLLHRYREGEASITAYADDYAFLIWGLLELYEATFEVRYLQTALDLNEDFIAYFWDEEHGGFYSTADDAEELLLRQKEIYDGAVPSGNSVAMFNLLRLARITARTELEEKAAQIGRAFSESVSKVPVGFTQIMCALDFSIGPAYEVVIAGESGADDTAAMLKALREQFAPNKVVVLNPAEQQSPPIHQLAEYTRYQSSIDGQATAYVCRNFNCAQPTTDINRMVELLREPRRETEKYNEH